MHGVTNLDIACTGKCHGVATISRRHHTIKQVDAASDRFEQVDRCAHTHQVTRLVDRQLGTRRRGDSIHLRWSFANAQATDRKAFKRQLRQLAGALHSQRRIQTALNDGNRA